MRRARTARSYYSYLNVMYKNTSQNRGFTLIELLVVIAIIGILASVVLASLNSARNKGADAAIKSNLNNMRAQAELYYDDNGNSYVGMCADPTIANAVASADSTNGTGGATTCIDGGDVSGAWAIEAALVASSSAFYCVDSTGHAGEEAGTTISSSDAVCG